MALKILYERIGLGADATEEQAVERIHALADENKELREQRDTMQKMLAEQHKTFEDAKAAKRKFELAEGRSYLQRAVDDQKIDKEDMEFLLEDWGKDSDRVRKLVEKKGYRTILAKRLSITGDTAPSDAIAEAKVRVAEMLANDTSKTLTEAQAYSRLWDEDKDLYERHTEARRAASEPKGGDR